MTITARYRSECARCQRAITPGDPIEWSKGSKPYHTSCPTAPARPIVVGPRTITVERVGRRSYLRGDTISVRGYLRSCGCHWDAEERAWWIGDAERAEEIAAGARDPLRVPAEAAPPKRVTRCVQCGERLDPYQQQRGFAFCSRDCAIERREGSGWSGYVDGAWHQGSDD